MANILKVDDEEFQAKRFMDRLDMNASWLLMLQRPVNLLKSGISS